MELHPAEKLPGGVRLYAPNLLAVEIGTGPAQPVNTAARQGGPVIGALDHVTMCAQDMEGTVSFFTDVLGFRLTDSVGNLRHWLRCGPNHHIVAVVAGADEMNHYAFNTADLNQIGLLGDLLSDRGSNFLWGPGRHALGENVFSYHIDPSGSILEVTCDMVQVTIEDEWVPKVWPAEGLSSAIKWGPPPAPRNAPDRHPRLRARRGPGMTTAPRHDGGIVVTAALTGPVATKDDHPGLPCSPEEIAAAAAAGKAGASVVHVHLRDEHGRPTADLGIAARAMDLIGESSDTIIQLSTGVGAGVSWQDRAKLVELRPRMASLNVCTMTFGNVEFRNPPDDVRRLAYRMGELGVKPELEIYDTGHLDFALALAEEGLLEPPLQFSVVMGIRGGMSPTPRNLLHTVSLLPQDAVWQIVAIGRAHLPLLTLAIALGGNARTGLEDTLMLTRGIQAPDNTALVRRAVEIAALYGRTPLDSHDTAANLQLKDHATG